MNDIPSGFRRLPGFIDDIYELETPIGRTVSSEVFKAFDRRAHRGIALWRTLAPIAPHFIEKFRARLTVVQRAPHVVPINIFGFDSGNIGFAVLSTADGRPMNAPVSDAVEVERRILSMLAILENLHDNDVVCGDICRESFILERDGTVCLFGVLGALEITASDRESSPESIRRYLPSRSGDKLVPTTQDDVEAVLVLVQELYASISIIGAGAGSKGVAMPQWIEDVVVASKSAIATGEGITIRQLRNDLERAKIEHCGRVDVPEVVADVNADTEMARDLAKRNKSRAAKGRANKASSLATAQKTKALAAVGVGMAVIAAVVFSGLSQYQSDTTEKSEVRHKVTDEELRQIAEWRDSTDEGAHQKLAQALRAAQTSEHRAFVFKAILDRSRRGGLFRATDMTAQYYRLSANPNTFGNEGDSATLLTALDPSMDGASRNGEFFKVFERSPQAAVAMAVAFALDGGSVADARDLIARYVGDEGRATDVGERSALALMLYVSDTSQRYSEDFVDRSEKVSSADLLWLLKELARTGRAEVTTIAQLVHSRKLITGAQSVFLEELRKGATLPATLRAALAAGALGILSQDEVAIFGQWYGAGSARVLEASILTANDAALKRSAFELLRGKPISDPYIATLLEYIQGAHAENSHEFAALVASLGLRDAIGAEALARELSGIDKASDSTALLQHMVKGAPYEVLAVVVPRNSKSIEPIELVDVLQHPDKRARVLAIEHLSTVNDILLVKLITQAYDEEKDADVRKAYESHIDTIRERLGS